MYKVTLNARGKQFEYNSAPGQSPLEAARNEFIPFPTGCQRGGCGMCKVKVLNGDYEQELVRSQAALSDEELDNSFALGCCMTPKSDLDLITIEDYENYTQKAGTESVKSSVLYPKHAQTHELALNILEAITNKAEKLQIKINADVVDEGKNFSINITID